ncbi:hypothetical protein Tco_0364799 [Tanacetum coccineum]
MDTSSFSVDAEVYYDTTIDMSANYSKTTFTSSEQVEVLGNDTGYIIQRKGPTWLFDLDYLTDSMNYHPVRSENQANLHMRSTIIYYTPSNLCREGPREEEQVFLDELERLKRQEKEANEEAELLRKEVWHREAEKGGCWVQGFISSHPLALIPERSKPRAVQTRSIVNQFWSPLLLLAMFQKQKRINHKGLPSLIYLLVFLSQQEPKKISEALKMTAG